MLGISDFFKITYVLSAYNVLIKKSYNKCYFIFRQVDVSATVIWDFRIPWYYIAVSQLLSIT